jgi:hypothetical protein
MRFSRTSTTPDVRRELRIARSTLSDGSPGRDVLTCALAAVEDPHAEVGGAAYLALSWLHEAICALLPADPRRDGLDERILRRAAATLDEELVARRLGWLTAA